MKLYNRTVGISNRVPPHRLPFDPRFGVSGLEQAANVLISKTGEIVSRSGSNTLLSGNFHSGYQANDGFYVSRGEINGTRTLCYMRVNRVDGGLSDTDMRNGMSQGHIDYTTRGLETFYCNGSQNGRLIGGTNHPWTDNDWTGGNTTDDFKQTPVGEHLGFLSGRVLVSVGDELFFTEYGLPGLYDAVRNRRRLGSRIIMICEVQSGAYISDEHSVYFASGTNPAEWNINKVLNYPALEWRKHPALVQGTDMGLEVNALCCLFGTVEGPVIGLPDGTPINLTKKDVKLPKCKANGGIMVVDDTLILMS